MNKDVAELWSNVGSFSIDYVKRFAATIYYLFKESDYKIDLLVGAGNSGVQMTRLVKIILDDYNIKIPILNIPIYRYKQDKEGKDQYEGTDYFNNDILLGYVKKDIGKIKFKTVLFVDDEIGEGKAAKAAIKLILKSMINKNKLNYLIVAEGHDFKPEWSFRNVIIKFCPYEKGIEGLFNVICYNVPYEYQLKIKDALPDLSSRKYMNVLLSEPIKEFNKGKPIFTNNYEAILKEKIKDFDKMQKKYLLHIKNLLSEGIKEYKEKKIIPFFLEK